MTSLLKGQQGVAMLMVIAFMALSVPMITGALALSGTLSKDSTVKTEILKRQYSALGGDQFGGYLVTEGGALCNGNTIDLNDVPVDVLVCDLPSEQFPPPPADDSRRLFSSITVAPEWFPPAVYSPGPPITEYPTFTITITNRDDEPQNLQKIHAMLPPGFEYDPDSTGGVTINEPAIQGQKLTWNLAPMGITLQPAAPGVLAEYRQLSFVAFAILDEGNYCTEAWADPGQIKTGTGLDALIQVGSPADDLCTGYAVSLDNTRSVAGGTVIGLNPITVDYTITFRNNGTLPLTLTQVRDLLPPGFVYTPGTTWGLTSNDPSTTVFQGRQRLDWVFDPPLTIASDSTNEVTFKVQGPFTGGHWNDAWLTFSPGEFADTQYTWPSAGIKVLETTEVCTTTGGVAIHTLTWKIDPDPGSFVVWAWQISQACPP